MFSFQLVFFYIGVTGLFLWLYRASNKTIIESIALTLMTVFVAREYWEIPIFVAGYLGLFDRAFPMVFHHILVVIVFVLLLQYSKIKFSKYSLTLLILTPILIYFLIFPFKIRHLTLNMYLARGLGFGVFGGIFINNS